MKINILEDPVFLTIFNVLVSLYAWSRAYVLVQNLFPTYFYSYNLVYVAFWKERSIIHATDSSVKSKLWYKLEKQRIHFIIVFWLMFIMWFFDCGSIYMHWFEWRNNCKTTDTRGKQITKSRKMWLDLTFLYHLR